MGEWDHGLLFGGSTTSKTRLDRFVSAGKSSFSRLIGGMKKGTSIVFF